MPLLAEIRKMFGGRAARDDAANGSPRALPDPVTADAVRTFRETADALRRLVESLDERDALARSTAERLTTLPTAIDSLGDLRRQSVKLVEAMGEHAETSRQHGEAVESALHRMHEALGGQTDAMVGATDRIEAIVRTVGGLSEELERLRGALGEIAATGSRSSEALRALAESGRRREEAFIERVGNWQRWTMVLIGIAALGSIATTTVLVLIAIRG